MSGNEFVRLNVGGKIYEVSRSLLEAHPSTMLARLVSERWQKDSSDEEQAIFIEGDGDRFRYVLDYMRVKEVHLPASVSKACLLKDLDYFGFQDINPDSITSPMDIKEAMKTLAVCEQKYKAKMEDCDERVKAIEKEKLYEMMAYDCFKWYSEHGVLTDVPVLGGRLSDQTAFSNLLGENTSLWLDVKNRAAVMYMFHQDSELDIELLNTCLAQYGLAYLNNRTNCHRTLNLKLMEDVGGSNNGSS